MLNSFSSAELLTVLNQVFSIYFLRITFNSKFLLGKQYGVLFNIRGLSLTYSDVYSDRAPDLPGDQTEEATNFIVKALAWRAGQGTVTRQAGEAGLSMAGLERGSLYSRGRDRDGCKLMVLHLANHVRGLDSLEEVKQVHSNQ